MVSPPGRLTRGPVPVQIIDMDSYRSVDLANPEPPTPLSPYLTAKQAAAYLRLSYSTFRKRAKYIVRQPQTGRYHVNDLDDYARSIRPRKKR